MSEEEMVYDPGQDVAIPDDKSGVIDVPPQQGQQISPYLNMIQTAVSQNVELEKIQQLVALAERVEDRQASKEMNMSLSRFQSDIPVIEKKGHVYYPGKDGKPATDFHFARLEDITEAIRPKLAQNMLSYRFELDQEKGTSFAEMAVTVTCIITHRDGATIKNSMTGYPDQSGSKNSIQALASTTTYLKRQTLSGALGIASIDMDDDGGDPSDFVATQEESTPQSGMDPERFEQLLPAWQGLVRGGKDPLKIIAAAKSKGMELSVEQAQIVIETK